MVINSLSKAYAMCGWRIGYAAGPAAIIDRMSKMQENFNSGANAAAQYAAVYALEHRELTLPSAGRWRWSACGRSPA